VPSKINPKDWDNLFTPNAPRRGGPLRALLNILATLILLALLGGVAVFLLNVREERTAQAIATATSFAATNIPLRTTTAQAELDTAATAMTARTASAAATPTPAPLTASVTNGGNVRESPVSGQPLDQVQAGETVQLLEKNQGASWFKITYNRNGQAITGWVSRTLLTIAPEVESQVP
jgi:hypothetical protein